MSGKVVFSKIQNITNEMSSFRDITESDKKQEKQAKIAIFISAAILAIGTIIATYYTSQATGSCWRNGELFVYSVGPLAVLPGIMGGGGTIALVVWGAVINFEKGAFINNNDSRSPSAIIEGELFHLTTDDLEKIHQRYDRHGMAFLPHNGVIDDKQAITLSQLIEHFGLAKKELNGFPIDNKQFLADVEANPRKYPEYEKAKKNINDLEDSWKELQAEILQNHTVQKIDD